MSARVAPDKTSIFVGLAFLLIAGIIATGGILWKNFVEYSVNAAGLPDVFSGIATKAPYESATDPESRREIIFSFTIPRGDLVQFIETMQPKLDQIVEKSGKSARIDVSGNEQEVVNKLNRGLADFGSISTMGYLRLRKSNRIKAVLERFFDPPKKSLMVVKKDDPAKTIEDLRGYRMAYRSTDQLPGLLTPISELEKHGLSRSDFFRQEFYSDNYSDSILGLQNDQFDCIVLTSNFFLEQPEEIRSSMRIVHESPPLPGGVYIVSTDRRSSFEQTVVGNFMKFGKQVQATEAFSGMFTTRQPDEDTFNSLEKEFLNEP